MPAYEAASDKCDMMCDLHLVYNILSCQVVLGLIAP